MAHGQEAGLGDSPRALPEGLGSLPCPSCSPTWLPRAPPAPADRLWALSPRPTQASLFLGPAFRHAASWLGPPPAAENKSLLHFSRGSGLTHKLLSEFYADACKRAGPFQRRDPYGQEKVSLTGGRAVLGAGGAVGSPQVFVRSSHRLLLATALALLGLAKGGLWPWKTMPSA